MNPCHGLCKTASFSRRIGVQSAGLADLLMNPLLSISFLPRDNQYMLVCGLPHLLATVKAGDLVSG